MKKIGQFIIKNKMENNIWFVAPWDGDPGRTLKYDNAKRYNTIRGARAAITYYMSRYSHIRKMNLVIIDANL